MSTPATDLQPTLDALRRLRRGVNGGDIIRAGVPVGLLCRRGLRGGVVVIDAVDGLERVVGMVVLVLRPLRIRSRFVIDLSLAAAGDHKLRFRTGENNVRGNFAL